MARQLRFDQRAIADLVEIRDYLLMQSATGADNVRAHIAATLDYLVDFPLMGRSTDDADVRLLPLKRYPYLIFYAVRGSEVVILHIRHASRRPIAPGELS
jgi:plasmid stabilization system protein ParE